MNYRQYDLCLACGTPWRPDIEAFASCNKIGSLQLLRLENAIKTSPYMLQLMVDSKPPQFCCTPHKAHLLHKSYHAPAVQYAMEHLDFETLSPVSKFPFVTNPQSKKNSLSFYFASWEAPEADSMISYSPLWKYMLAHLPRAEELTIQAFKTLTSHYELTVNTCSSCNYPMTCRFWYKYHLYTDTSSNNNRIIPPGVIEISQVNTKKHDLVEESHHWKAGKKLATKYPARVYQRQQDYFTSYLVYYLHQCQPPDSDDYKQLPSSQKLALKYVYITLSWIILQVTCMCCEWQLGSESKGRLHQHPKSLLGGIELYTAYFGWFLGAYQFPEMQSNMTFTQWMQYYIWDLPHSPSFVKHEVKLLAHEIIPPKCDIPSRLLVEQVCEKLMRAYQIHMLPILSIIHGKVPVDSDLDFKQHYVSPKYWAMMEELGRAAVANNFDSMLHHLGVRPMWLRVVELCQEHTPPLIQEKIVLFLKAWARIEIQNIAQRQKCSLRKALEMYNENLLNPVTHTIRGRWASVYSLQHLGAFNLQNEI